MEQQIKNLFFATFSQEYHIYHSSIKKKGKIYFFMVKDKKMKYLVVVGEPENLQKFDFEAIKEKTINISREDLTFKVCPLTHDNLILLRIILDYLKPTCSNRFNMPSFGTGDRLGIATPGHIKAFQGKNIFPILAQQSVREIERTESNWQKVMDNTIWGCFEMGYDGFFGADADHVKDFKSLQGAIDCGFTLYTLDPSDYINSELVKCSKEEIRQKYYTLPNRRELENRYLNKEFLIGSNRLRFDLDKLVNIVLTYGKAIEYITKSYQFIKERNKNEFELEVSIDETLCPTSPLAHLWIVSELHYRGVDFQNLAPHYIGDWEKGIEYIGDINAFQEELKIHCQIASHIGGYRLSLHSGSDKFSIYSIFAQETSNSFHIKTAGTSWLEALGVIAQYQPDLYRGIHTFALSCFDKDRSSYKLSTNLEKIPDINKLQDVELIDSFSNNNVRQLIHITYGSILKEKDEEGQYRFRDRIYQALFEREKAHYQAVAQHIKRHLDFLSK